MEYYRFILYVLFGILPSLIWLFYYLKRDSHPEPKRMIAEVFFYGVLITVPVFFLQIQLSELLKHLQAIPFFASFPFITDILKWFFVIALSEELLKYLVVRATVFKSREMDEPLDVMLYMIVVALGFAAVENILYLFSPVEGLPLSSVVEAAAVISFIRFIGATFLHTLCSGILGYFVALSFFDPKNRLKLTLTGISFAVLLHGTYDFSIITLGYPADFIIPVLVVIGSSIFLMKSFEKIKKLKSMCEV